MTILLLVLSITAIAGVIGVIISLAVIGKNLAKYVRKLKETLQSLKEDLEQQISTLDRELKAYSENQNQWKDGIKSWAREELKVQAIKYELHVKGIHEALNKIGNSREGIANEITRFVRVFVAALKGERALFEELTKVALPGDVSPPSPQQKTAGSKSNEPGEGLPPPSS